jgi:hypothetical protein
VARAVQDGDAAAMLPAQEAEQELGHACFIGSRPAELNLTRVAYT